MNESDKVEGIRRQALRLVSMMAPGAVGTALAGHEKLIDELGFDSVRLLELLMVIEKTFGLPAHRPEQLADVTRVDDVVALTVRAVGSRVTS